MTIIDNVLLLFSHVRVYHEQLPVLCFKWKVFYTVTCEINKEDSLKLSFPLSKKSASVYGHSLWSRYSDACIWARLYPGIFVVPE